jgi:hypothetical protein
VTTRNVGVIELDRRVAAAAQHMVAVR